MISGVDYPQRILFFTLLFEPVWQLQPDRERFIPVMERYWKTYPPVYLYYPKNAGKTKRVKALIDFLISTTGR
ncbi:putative LysR-family transcriptional regulator [Escherichia coli]|nr:putative LysR-family transcriptional regulator [Escherichia coli]